MSKKTIYLLGILATLIIGFFLHWHFCCNEDCTKNAVVDETTKRNASAPLPFKFEDGDITIRSNDNFNFMSSNHAIVQPLSEDLLSCVKEMITHLSKNKDKSINITGVFKEDENNPSNFENLGIARAKAIERFLIEHGLSADRISTFGKKDIKRFADRYGVEVKNIRSGQQGNLADFEGDPEKIKKMLTSTQYGMEPEDANDLLGIKDKPKVDKKTDKKMSSAADKANMKMDRDEIMGVLNAKNEPFAEEVYDILDDKFKKMGSLGKELKMDVDTLASYEMGIYDMSEKEYEQGRKELKKKLSDYYKKELDEGIKGLSKVKTRYNR